MELTATFVLLLQSFQCLFTQPTFSGKTQLRYAKFRGADHLRPGCRITSGGRPVPDGEGKG